MKVIIQKKILKSDVNELSSKLKLKWVQSSHAKNKTWEIWNSSDLRNNTSYIEQWFLFFNPITQTSIYDHDIINIFTKKICTRNEKGKVKKQDWLVSTFSGQFLTHSYIPVREFFFQDFELVQSGYQYLEIVMPVRTKFFSFLVISWFIC